MRKLIARTKGNTVIRYKGYILDRSVVYLSELQFERFKQVYSFINESYVKKKKPVRLKDILAYFRIKQKYTVCMLITYMAGIVRIEDTFDVDSKGNNNVVMNHPFIWFEERQTRQPRTNKNNYRKVKQIYPYIPI